jgi:hypothetical protein
MRLQSKSLPLYPHASDGSGVLPVGTNPGVDSGRRENRSRREIVRFDVSAAVRLGTAVVSRPRRGKSAADRADAGGPGAVVLDEVAFSRLVDRLARIRALLDGGEKLHDRQVESTIIY